jgi:hypothetical protein
VVLRKKNLDFQTSATSVDNLTISHVHAPYSMHPCPQAMGPFLDTKKSNLKNLLSNLMAHTP